MMVHTYIHSFPQHQNCETNLKKHWHRAAIEN